MLFKVKDFEELKEIYGEDENGNICNEDSIYVKEMENILDEDRIVDLIESKGKYKYELDSIWPVKLDDWMIESI